MRRCSSSRCLSDFPEMPYLARVLDGIPREKRLVVDLWGRFNDTIRVDHDFNHLEKLDGHAGWEWEDAIGAVAGTILQPTLAPQRSDVRPFLFHGYRPRFGRETAQDRARRRGGMARQALWRDVRRQQLAALGAGSPVPRRLRSGPRKDRARMPRRLGLGQAAGLGRGERHRGGRHRSGVPRRAWRGVP